MIHGGVYNTNSQIKFKTSMLRSGLSDYSDGHVLVKEIVIDPNTADLSTATNIKNKKKHYLKFVLHLLVAQVK